MANTAAVCNSFRVELLNGIHAFGTTVVRAGTGADTYKAALYLATATVNATTTAYSATNELAATGNYSAGGVTVTNATPPTNTGAIAFWTPSASFVWSALTASGAFDAVLVYNATQSNKAVAVYTFGSQLVTVGTFTLTMPANDSSNALLRLA